MLTCGRRRWCSCVVAWRPGGLHLVDGGGSTSAVDGAGGAGGVVTELLGDELLAVAGLPVGLALVGAHVALSDKAVALGEGGVGAFDGTSVLHEIVKGRVELGERPVVVAPVALLAVLA